MHAVYLYTLTCCGPTAARGSRRDSSLRWVWFTCAAMCTTHINIQSFLNCSLHDWSYLLIPKNATGYKFRGLEAEMKLSVSVGLVCVVLSLLCLCVRPAGLSVCSLPGVEKGLAVASQPWPAGLSCPHGAQKQEALACLHLQVVNLTSYCTDTSIIVIKGWSNLFIYWFPTGWRQD